MRVASFNIHVASSSLGGRFYNPRILWERKQAVFIEIVDEQGFRGWGECWTFDQSADALIRFIQTELRPLVIDREFASIEDAWDEMWATTVLSGRHGLMAAALSGLDCALWDIRAQGQGLSLGKAIAKENGTRHVPVYASGGLYQKDGDINDLQAEMRSYVEDGYRRVKIKFGAKEFEEDVERVRAVRDAVGDGVELIVDAVYSLDRRMAERWLPEWRANRVEAVQAPFPARDWDSMRWLNQECGMPVMVFEAENRYVVFRSLLELNAVGVLQFSPIAVGGVTASLALIGLAEEFGCPVSLQCSSTWLAEMIALQIASARNSVDHVEIHGFHRMMFERADPKHLRLVSGAVDLGQTLGIGFSPPYERLEAFNTELPDCRKKQ